MVFIWRFISSVQVRPLNFHSINFEIFNSVTSLGWSHLSRNLSVPMSASAAHRVIEILSQKCEYCLGRGMGWQIICVPVKLRSVHRAEQGWYQLKQKPDQSTPGTGDLPGLSADVSDNNVSLSHYYIKIPLAPGHFPWRCGRFLSPCYDTPRLLLISRSPRSPETALSITSAAPSSPECVRECQDSGECYTVLNNPGITQLVSGRIQWDAETCNMSRDPVMCHKCTECPVSPWVIPHHKPNSVIWTGLHSSRCQCLMSRSAQISAHCSSPSCL